MSFDLSHSNSAILALDRIDRTYISPLLSLGKGSKSTKEPSWIDQQQAPQSFVPEICRLVKSHRLIANLTTATQAGAHVKKRWLSVIGQLLRSSSKHCSSMIHLHHYYLGLSLLRCTLPQLDYESFRSSYASWLDLVFGILRLPSAQLLPSPEPDDLAGISLDYRRSVKVLAIHAATLLLILGFRWPDIRRDLTASSAKQTTTLSSFVPTLLKALKKEPHLARPALTSLLRCLQADSSAFRPFLAKIERLCFNSLDAQDPALRAAAVSCLVAIPLAQKALPVSLSSHAETPSAPSTLAVDGWLILVKTALGSLKKLIDFAFPLHLYSPPESKDYAPYLTPEIFSGLLSFEFKSNPQLFGEEKEGRSPSLLGMAWIQACRLRLQGLTHVVSALFSASYPAVPLVPVAALVALSCRFIAVSTEHCLDAALSSSHDAQDAATIPIFRCLQPLELIPLADLFRATGHRILSALLGRAPRAVLLPYHHFVAEMLLGQLHVLRGQDDAASPPSDARLGALLGVFDTAAAFVQSLGASVWDRFTAKLVPGLLRELAGIGARNFEHNGAASEVPGSRAAASAFYLEQNFAASCDYRLLEAVTQLISVILSTSAARLTPDLRVQMEKVLVLQATIAQKSMMSVPCIRNIYTHGPSRLALLQMLFAMLCAPCTTQPLSLPYVLSIFRTAASDPYRPIALLALQAQGVCLSFSRPRSLPFASTNSNLSQILASSIIPPQVDDDAIDSSVYTSFPLKISKKSGASVQSKQSLSSQVVDTLSRSKSQSHSKSKSQSHSKSQSKSIPSTSGIKSHDKVQVQSKHLKDDVDSDSDDDDNYDHDVVQNLLQNLQSKPTNSKSLQKNNQNDDTNDDTNDDDDDDDDDDDINDINDNDDEQFQTNSNHDDQPQIKDDLDDEDNEDEEDDDDNNNNDNTIPSVSLHNTFQPTHHDNLNYDDDDDDDYDDDDFPDIQDVNPSDSESDD